MSQIRYVEHTRRDEILTDALAKNTPVVLTRKGADGWVVAKSRFVAACANRSGLLIAVPGNCNQTAWPPLVCGELLGIAFRRGHKKCLFNAPVNATSGPRGAEFKGQMFAVRWPDDLQEMQRRVYQRVMPPPGRSIRVRVESDPPCHGQLEDLSAGGIRFRSTENPRLAEGQSVRVALALRSKKPEIVLDATFRHCQATADGAWSVGLQFVGLETSPEGQRQLVGLARVVTDFQRAHARRHQAPLHSGRQAR